MKGQSFKLKRFIILAISIILVALQFCFSACAPLTEGSADDLLNNPGLSTDKEVVETPDQMEEEEEIVNILGEVDSNNDIVIYEELETGSYLLKYEALGVALDNYAPITYIEASQTSERIKYCGLIPKNVAPLEADAIGVYNQLNERVGYIELGSLKAKELGEKLYSFGAISDSHVGKFDGEEDLTNALTFFRERGDVEFIALCGDAVDNANNSFHLEAYQNIVKEYSLPVYISSGNHEGVILSTGDKTYDDIKEYFTQSQYKEINQKVFHSFEKAGDVFIMLGINGNSNYGKTFSEEEVKWLYETLEANKDKRCFLFHHYFPKGGSGDAVECYPSDGLRGENGEVFFELLSHYPNVIYFHGHTHAKFSVQELNEQNTVDTSIGMYNVHIPSITAPSYPNEEMENYVETQEDGEGYVIEVYEKGILLLGRDFERDIYSPIGTYFLETSIKETEGAFHDKTGLIITEKSNTIKEAYTWYESLIDRSEITKVTFTKSFSGEEYDEVWDASAHQNGQVIVYRVGTELFIVGNEYGVLANANSKDMFKSFEQLKEVVGFENFDTYNLVSFESAFENCRALEEIDLSMLNLSRAQKFNKMFKNCTLLNAFKLPESIGDNQIKDGVLINFTSTFENCKNLNEADLSALSNERGSVYYLSCTFMGCTSLRDVKLGEITVTTFAYTFYGNKALEYIDLASVDFSRCGSMIAVFMGCGNLEEITFSEEFTTSTVKEMDKLFYGCEKLILDCSNWDITNVKSMADFNYNAPCVILPEVE